MRKYNFSAGPCTLSLDVLERVQSQLLDYENSGMSVMEMSHRSKEYEAINDESEALLRELMNVPDNYFIIFIQGGASMQFEAVPLNLAKHKRADYITTGNWASKAYKEAKKFGDYVEAASSADKGYSYIPWTTDKSFRKDIDYVHYCHNNTIFGTRFNYIPETGSTPLVCDYSSSILSEEIDVSKYGVIYAGAQKNIGPAGMTVVIVRKDLLELNDPLCPTMMKWKTQTDNKSMFNTPPCFPTYVAMEGFRWLKKIGGVKAIHEINVAKAKILYDMIDSTDFYTNHVRKEDRSIMNIPFITPSPELDAKFLSEAGKEGLITLKGHKVQGGMRASLYNAMPVEGVKRLVKFMQKFELENKK